MVGSIKQRDAVSQRGSEKKGKNENESSVVVPHGTLSSLHVGMEKKKVACRLLNKGPLRVFFDMSVLVYSTGSQHKKWMWFQ